MITLPTSSETGTKSSRPGDLVLLPGDLSMAQNHRELQPTWHGSNGCPGPRCSHLATTIDGGTTPRRFAPSSGSRCSPSRAMPWQLTGSSFAAPTGAPVDNRSRRPDRSLAALDREISRWIKGWRRPRNATRPRDSALRPLALSSLRRTFTAWPLRRAPRAVRRDRVRLWSPHNQSHWSVAVQGTVARRPLSLRRGRRDRLSAPCGSHAATPDARPNSANLLLVFTNRSGERAKQVTTFVQCIRRSSSRIQNATYYVS